MLNRIPLSCHFFLFSFFSRGSRGNQRASLGFPLFLSLSYIYEHIIQKDYREASSARAFASSCPCVFLRSVFPSIETCPARFW